MKLIAKGVPLGTAACKAGMCENTARKYREAEAFPLEVRETRAPRAGRTRLDPFAEVWPELEGLLEVNPGLQALTLFQALKRRFPGRYSNGQLRTLQRRVKLWRGLAGPGGDVRAAAYAGRVERVRLLPPHRVGSDHPGSTVY